MAWKRRSSAAGRRLPAADGAALEPLESDRRAGLAWEEPLIKLDHWRRTKPGNLALCVRARVAQIAHLLRNNFAAFARGEQKSEEAGAE